MKSGNIFHNGIIATAIAATTFLSFSVHVTHANSQGEDNFTDVSLRGKRNEGQIEKDRLLMPNGDGRFHESENRIVGGTESAVGEFPYYVELLFKDSNSHYCGGTLIAPRVVLTAAHCDQGYVGQNVLVGGYEVGVSNNHGTESIKVEAQVIHPNYNDNTLANDFLLLRLDTDAKLGTPRASISSADDVNYPAAGTTSRVIGLGALTSGGGSPSILRDVNVPVVDPDTCDDMYGGSIEKDVMLCAGDIDDGGEDSCQGDSGGPLVIEQSSEVHELVGVVSWGIGCADRRYPGVYAKVGARNEWIQEVVCTQWGLSADFCTAGSCVNVAGWYDSDGEKYDCNWYSDTADACSNYGDGYENFGYTANKACCACGGGTPRGDITSPPTQSPTRVPTTSPTTSPTRNPTTSPTSPPTQSPTRNPTTSPTSPPTQSPTRSPTTSPTPPQADTTPPPTRSPTRSPTTSPTAPPTPSPTRSPTTSPTPPPTLTGGTCADFSGWYDSDGEEYDCDWYSNTADACSDYGDGFENFGYTANEACCACGGGTLGDTPIFTPPTPSPTPSCCQCWWGGCRSWCC